MKRKVEDRRRSCRCCQEINKLCPNSEDYQSAQIYCRLISYRVATNCHKLARLLVGGSPHKVIRRYLYPLKLLLVASGDAPMVLTFVTRPNVVHRMGTDLRKRLHTLICYVNRLTRQSEAADLE